MATQLVIAGRKALPKGKSLALSLEYEPDEDEDDADFDIDEGSLDLWEAGDDDPDFTRAVAAAVGFTPASILVIRPAGWVMSDVLGEELARAVGGVVLYFAGDGSPQIEYDAKRAHRPSATRAELVKRVKKLFEDPRPALKRRAARGRAEADATPPAPGSEWDWSDV